MKKILSLTAAVLAIAFIVVFVSCKSAQPATEKTFAFNFQKGAGYTYEMVWDMDQLIMGQENKISVLGNYSMAVVEEESDRKILEVIFQRFVMDMSMMGMEMNIDTDKPVVIEEGVDLRQDPSGIMAKMFGAIKGKAFQLVINKEGDIEKVTGFDAIVKSMVDSLNIPEEAKGQMRMVASQQFNEQAMKDQFVHALFIFPNKKVAVGDSWIKGFETKGQAPAKYTTTFTVTSIEGDHVNLRTQTKISSLSGTTVDLNGEQTGTLVVDKQSGLVKHGEFLQDIRGTAEGVEVNIKGRGKIKGSAL